MDILIITFALKDMADENYRSVCDQLAPAFAAVEGLESKVWLAAPDTNTYGGVYTFGSAADLDGFLASELFASVAAHPNLDNPKVQRFQVMVEPSRVTRGLLAVGR